MRGFRSTPAQDNGCEVLHQTARLEEEIYGEIVSDSIRDHEQKCRLNLMEYAWA